MEPRAITTRKAEACRLTWHRLMPLSALALSMLCACSDRAPPIGRDLPKTFGYTPAFEQRLRQRFPIGSDEQNLLTELRSERFTIDKMHDSPSRVSALYKVSGLPCGEEWTVQWSADQGKITEITGVNRQICF
jgi:hypothetical protein